MRLADERCHRTLRYIAAMQRQGISLTVGDVKAYAQRADRSQTGGKRMTVADQYQYFLRSVTGLPRRAIEAPVPWLNRVRWIEVHPTGDPLPDTSTVTLSPIGRAALRALEEEAVDLGDAASAVTLDKDDPTALAKVIEKIADVGECALVDRYFSLEAFLPIAQRTEVDRVLTGPHQKARVLGLGQALADYSPERRLEIRVDDEDQHHDRFLIPPAGSVWALGTSISGVGARYSVMVEIKDDGVADAIRQNFEQAWSGGRRLNPADQVDEEPRALDEGDSSDGSLAEVSDLAD